MNKKTYITPEMEVMNVEVEEMIATSAVSLGIDEEGADNVITDSRGRRGSWGNLWEN